jgi:hypothetical protein
MAMLAFDASPTTASARKLNNLAEGADLAQEVVQEAQRERIAGLAVDDARERADDERNHLADARDQAADERDRAADEQVCRRPGRLNNGSPGHASASACPATRGAHRLAGRATVSCGLRSCPAAGP